VRIQRRRACVSALGAWTTIVVFAVTSGCSGDVRAAPMPSAEGLGDPYYRTDGNTGYDVLGYAVTTTYDPTTSSFASTTRITARATSHQSRFDVDLSTGLSVTGVTVDGAPATFSRIEPHELVIHPRSPLSPGTALDVVVSYHGPVGDSGPISGWHPLSGGGGVMAGEPHSCAFWYPCNDHPTDKATFRLTATVPSRFTVLSNGLQGPTTSAGSGSTATKTYRWHLDTPTATYLTTILVDELTVQRSTLSDGTPVVDAYSPGARNEEANEARLPAILRLLASKFGPYPAPAAGGLFVDSRVGFSLETFSRPVYTAQVPLTTIVHENAHQWWGDNVSIERWKDVCLNECMASYAQWLWREHNGADLDAYYRRTVNQVDFSVPLYDMGPGNEFTYAGVYLKGAYFEHALRRYIGDDATYFDALQGIQQDFAGENMSMLELRDQLSRRTGVDLTDLWREWVLSTQRPSVATLFPGTLAT
jgi:aminopeptidase N